MRISVGIIGMGLAMSPTVWAGEPTTREVATTQAIETAPLYWFERAVSYCATTQVVQDPQNFPRELLDRLSSIPPKFIERKDVVVNVDRLAKVFSAMVQSGEGDRATALAREYDPKMLRGIAVNWALVGNAEAALASAAMMDEEDRPSARYSVAMTLIRSGKPEEAEKIVREGKVIRKATIYASMIEKLPESASPKSLIILIEALGKALPAGDDLLTPEIHARAYIKLGAAQLASGDKAAGRASFKKAMQIVEDVDAQTMKNTAVRVAEAQAFAGDLEMAEETSLNYKCFEAGEYLALTYVAGIKRGAITADRAIQEARAWHITVPLHRIRDVAMETQIQNKDFKAAAATCLEIHNASEVSFNTLQQIVNGFMSKQDEADALAFADAFEPPTRALLYAQAGQHADFSKHAEQAWKILADFNEKPPVSSSPEQILRRDAVKRLARMYADKGDFKNAGKTVLLIESPKERWPLELEFKAMELASAGKLQEAKAWVFQLENSDDRAIACMTIGKTLANANRTNK